MVIQNIKENTIRITRTVLRGISGGYDRGRRSAAPATAGGRDSVSEEYRSGDSLKSYINNIHIINNLGFAASSLLGLLLLLVITPLYNVTGVEDSEAATSYNPSESSITFSTGRNTATISGTPTTSGDFISSSDNAAQVASFDVTTNNATGYTLSIAAKDSNSDGVIDTSLANGSATLASLPSDSTGLTVDDFNKDEYNNKWGYMPSKVGSSDNIGTNAKFYPMTSTARTLDATSSANSTANNYTIKLGVRINYNQAAGTYTVADGTKFELTVVGNPGTYTITYNTNTADTVSNMPSPNPASASSTTDTYMTISSNTPTRTYYGFLGWCTVGLDDLEYGSTSTAAYSTCANAGGTYYASSSRFYLDATTKNAVNLYATWVETSYGYIQDFSVSSCQSIASSRDILVTDRRDGADYTVRYINDACWMTRNLRITGTISKTDSNFTRVDTWDVHVADLAAGNSYTEARSHVPTSTDADTNGNKPMDTYTAKRLGVWYNYCATSAGQVCLQTQTNAAQDICPRGWHLPSYNTNPGALSGTTGSVTSGGANNASLFSPIYGGRYYDGTFNDATTFGNWWSATAYNAYNQYTLVYDGGSLVTSFYDVKRNGFYIRCVRTPDYEVTISLSGGASGVVINGATYTNGQKVTLHSGVLYDISGTFNNNYEFSSWSATSGGTLSTTSELSSALNVTSATTLTLTGKSSKLYMWNATSADCGQTMYDNRDGTERAYATKKIGSLCWMTTNLALGSSSQITLSSSTSNVNGGYNLPTSSVSGFTGYSTAQGVYNAGFQACSSSQPCYGYYTYAAATAGANPSSGASNYDICPANWRLPTQAEYTSLTNDYKSGALLRSYWSAVYSGHRGASAFGSIGSSGYYWSSTAYNSGGAYNLGFDSSSSYVVGNSKGSGYAIRCVAKS